MSWLSIFFKKLYSTIGVNNIAIGASALANTQLDNNIAIGFQAMQSASGAGDNIAIGTN